MMAQKKAEGTMQA